MNKIIKLLIEKMLDILLYILFLFYICMGIAIFFIPSYKNSFTLISAMSTILTLFVCCIFSFSVFDIKKIIYSLCRCLVFTGMMITYIWYLKTEFSLISIQFNLGALSFDLFTSSIAYMYVKEFFERKRNDNNN